MADQPVDPLEPGREGAVEADQVLLDQRPEGEPRDREAAELERDVARAGVAPLRRRAGSGMPAASSVAAGAVKAAPCSSRRPESTRNVIGMSFSAPATSIRCVAAT